MLEIDNNKDNNIVMVQTKINGEKENRSGEDMKLRYLVKNMGHLLFFRLFLILFFFLHLCLANCLLGKEIVDREIETDVCVVGGGSAGCAAAIAAAREGVQVVLVEKMERLGGTGTNALVSSWEGGPGCELAHELFSRMKERNGAGVARSTPLKIQGSYGARLIDNTLPEEPYEISLVRAQPPKGEYRSVPYKAEVFDQVIRTMLKESGSVLLLDRSEFLEAESNQEKTKVESILVRCFEQDLKNGTRQRLEQNSKQSARQNSEQKFGQSSEQTLERSSLIRIKAKVFIDSTGSVFLCRNLGCSVRIGREAKREYNESLAPEKGDVQLNALTRCYRVEPCENPHREKIDPKDKVAFPKAAWITGWKDGTRCINMMAMMQGEELKNLGYEECMKRSENIVRNHWNWLQQSPDFANYELVEIAPMIGIREDYRVVTRYVLCQRDLEETWENQKHGDMIAIADHPCDIHGKGGGLVPVVSAYGIPYRCLIPKGDWSNLLVACRGAGFSHVAAASCRLQRTMIQLGHAAGVAAAWSARNKVPVDKIDIELLTKKMDARKRYPR